MLTSESGIKYLLLFFLNFAMTSHHSCGATDILCFGLWLTTHGGQATVGAPLPAPLWVMILRVNSESNAEYILLCRVGITWIPTHDV